MPKDAIQSLFRLGWRISLQYCTGCTGPESFGGGMEYPTSLLFHPNENEKTLDNTIAHEIGHNWFYGILASNERDTSLDG